MDLFNDLFGSSREESEPQLNYEYTEPKKKKFGRNIGRPITNETLPTINEEETTSEDQFPEGYMPNLTPTYEEEEPYVPTNRGSGDPVYNKPTPTITEDTTYGPTTPPELLNPHIDTHPDNTHSEDHNETEAETTGMDLGQTAEAQPEQQSESGLGGAEDRPTYEGNTNMKGEIITKVIDAISDVISEYILNKDGNRRRLKGVGWGMGNIIPSVMGDNARTAMDRIAFTNTFMGSPQTAITGAAISLIKKRLDAMDGTNPFEEVGRTRADQKLRDIKLYRSIDSYITKSTKGDSLVEKAKHYLIAEANQITMKGTNRMKDLGFIHKEEYRFIRSAVVMPYIILAVGFYFAYHKRNLNISEYHGVFKDMVLTRVMKFVLKKTLGIDKDIANFGIDILENVPQELINAFVRNIDKKSGVFDEEVVAINKFVEFIRKEYRETFGGGYYKDVRKLQGQNIDLVGLMNSLHTSRVLHLFAIQISTADNVVWEALNNTGLFLGLLELAAIHSRGRQDLGGGEDAQDKFLHNSYAVGLVKFTPYNKLPRTKKENKLLATLFDLDNSPSDEKFRVVKDGNNYLLAISGSKFKKGDKDLIDTDYEANMENVAGSKDFYKTPRYMNALRALEDVIEKAKKTNGNVSVGGYSLGGRVALSLASHFHSIPFHIYEPVIPKNDEMDRVFSNLQKANVKIHRVEGSSISKHLEDYKLKYRFHLKRHRQKRMSSHSLSNFG